MKKTFKTMLALMAGAMVFTACNKDDIYENTPEQNPSLFKPMTFYASMEGQGGATRATIDGLDIKWVDGDKISIFDGSTENCGNQEFTLTDDGGSTSGTFEGNAAEADTYYALYPYTASKIIERDVTPAEAEAAAGSHVEEFDTWRMFVEFDAEDMLLEDLDYYGISEENQNIIIAYLKGETIPTKEGALRNSSDLIENVVFSAEQTATAGSADPKAMLMISKTTDANTFQFKNVCAYVKVTPKFDCTSISLKNYDTEKLAGTVTLDYNNGTPTADVTANGVSKVSLTGTITAGNTYYIAVLPETLTNGFTLTFKTSDGEYEKSTTKTLTLARNKVINLGSFEKTDLTKIETGKTGTAKAKIDGKEVNVSWVQLWENGPKWAAYNVGVTDGMVESYGGYYAWGGSQNTIDDHNTGSKNLYGQDDTATNIWGSKWRMPTSEEFKALFNKCDVESTAIEGVNGCKLTGRGDYSSYSVFLPYAGRYWSTFETDGKRALINQGDYGFYWSSTSYGSDKAYHQQIAGRHLLNECSRDIGFSVRAVLNE